MYSWFFPKRKQRRPWSTLGTAAVVAAGGLAAYYLYTWYFGEDEEEGNKSDVASSLGPGSRLDPETQQRLREHLETLKTIARTKTLPEQHQSLCNCLLALSGTEAIKEDLRRLKNTPPEPSSSTDPSLSERKLALWGELRDRSICHLVAATWLLPALSLLVHTQVIVLGRHLYIQSQAGTAAEGSVRSMFAWGRAHASKAVLKTFTVAQQEAFMSYSAFLLHDGLKDLLPLLLANVRKQLLGREVQQALSVESAVHMLSGVYEAIESSIEHQHWVDALLPTITVQPAVSGAAAHSVSATSNPPLPDDSEMAQNAQGETGNGIEGDDMYSLPTHCQPAGLNEAEAAAVIELLYEVRTVLQAQAFRDTLVSAVKEIASSVAGSLADSMEDEFAAWKRSHGEDTSDKPHIALALVMPMVAQLAKDVFRSGGEGVDAEPGLAERVASMPEFESLLGNVYTLGPFIDEELAKETG